MNYTNPFRRRGAIAAGYIALIAVAVFALVIGVWWASTSNSEVRLRNLIAAKQKDNESELDNMTKKIGQSAAVTEEQSRQLKDIVVGYAQARTVADSGKFATLVKESVPKVSPATFVKLMNIVTGSRDSFTMRQKEILDMKREHDNLRLTFPSSIVVGGRPEINVVVVTSSRAQEAMRTGVDDDTTLFKHQQQ